MLGPRLLQLFVSCLRAGRHYASSIDDGYPGGLRAGRSYASSIDNGYLGGLRAGRIYAGWTSGYTQMAFGWGVLMLVGYTKKSMAFGRGVLMSVGLVHAWLVGVVYF